MSNAALRPMLVGIEVSIVGLFLAVAAAMFRTESLLALAGLTLLFGVTAVIRGYQADPHS